MDEGVSLYEEGDVLHSPAVRVTYLQLDVPPFPRRQLGGRPNCEDDARLLGIADGLPEGGSGEQDQNEEKQPVALHGGRYQPLANMISQLKREGLRRDPPCRA